jgi:dTDP-4-amino-4,6-dideoxygalactose transaminase
MKKNKILLWKSWSKSPITPLGTDLKLAKFKIKLNPNSINISSRILFLPNHSLVTLNDIERIVKLINNYS